MKAPKPKKNRLPYTSEILNFGAWQSLSTYEVMTLIVFRSYMSEDKSSVCWASYDTLAKAMRCSRSTAKRAVASLASDEKKIISIGKKRVRKGGLDNNEYRFLDVHRFKEAPRIGSRRTYARVHTEPIIGSQGTYTIGSQRTSSKQEKKQEKKPSSSKRTDDDTNFSSKITTRKTKLLHSTVKEENPKLDDKIKTESLNSDAKISHELWLAQQSECFKSQFKRWAEKEVQNFSGKIESKRRFKSWLVKQVREETKRGQDFYDQYTSEKELKQLVQGMYGNKAR